MAANGTVSDKELNTFVHNDKGKTEDVCRMVKTSFYGRKRRDPKWAITLARQEKRLKSTPVPSTYRTRIGGPVGCWRPFYRQQSAFQYARALSKDLHVFSYESESFVNLKGQRMYLVTNCEQFWHQYSQMKQSQKHHYEVIPEGAVCKLYFDLEYKTSLNPDHDGARMVEVFIKYVCAQLKRYFNLDCDEQQVLQLEASTKDKFSRHLIVMLDNAVFKDNIHAGNFVHHICYQLLHSLRYDSKLSQRSSTIEDPDNTGASLDLGDPDNTGATHEQQHACGDSISVPVLPDEFLQSAELSLQDLSCLMVKDKDDKEILFCDTAVYTRNRNFRLYLSSKLHKNNPLIVSSDNKYKHRKPVPKGQTKSMDSDYQLFLDSLIANVGYSEKLRVLNFEGQGRVSARQDSQRSDSESQQQPVADTIEGYSYSPYPEVDDFIRTVITKGGVQGVVRHWTYFAQGEMLIYDILGNRWCDNVGRPHRSNNIMMIADLSRRVYYQKCHDPDCKAVNYKSAEMPLPEKTLPAMFLEDDFEVIDEEFGDEELLSVAEEMERAAGETTELDDQDDDAMLLMAVQQMENDAP